MVDEGRPAADFRPSFRKVQVRLFPFLAVRDMLETDSECAGRSVKTDFWVIVRPGAQLLSWKPFSNCQIQGTHDDQADGDPWIEEFGGRRLERRLLFSDA